ncbi:MAG TPA: helix-turn-helix domain-containing protein [Acidimicrobiales bacterium]|jgi:AcrR family transcriptional regulator
MGRWAPGATGRLVESALELYRERGFDQTTVAEIAARAGLTERTFFRHFADKREVLFAGSGALFEQVAAAVAAAPPGTTPFDAVAAGLDAAATVIGERHEFAEQRNAVIAANPALHERELSKLASLAAAMADALGARGVRASTAALTSETGMAVFKVAFDRWVADGTAGTLPELVRDAMDELRVVAAAD